MKLVIVESPTKCHTIQRYLGTDYVVKGCEGHVREIATKGKGGLGIDIKNNYKPTYQVIKERYKIIKDLKELVKKADEVIIATDPDREGEAIAWHLCQVLDLPVESTKRLIFHEITRDSITEAIKNPTTIDMNLVNSQETRAIVDRIFGFELSKLVKTQIGGTSAGRVQSPTLKLIIDHENEIKKFVPEKYFNLDVELKNENSNLEASFYQYKGKSVKLDNENLVKEIISKIGKTLKIVDINKQEKTINAKPPYTTASLQQDAINKFNYSAKQVSNILQKLFEGVDIGGELVGLITYIRTDSTSLSETYINRANNYIKEVYGQELIGEYKAPKLKKGDEHNQNAHEAIRPTSNHRTPDSIKQYLAKNEYNIYKLIYNHTLSYLMKPKKEELTTVYFGNDEVTFKLTGTKTIYKGYELLTGTDKSKELTFEPVINSEYEVAKVNSEEKTTQPPARYNEAKVIHLMEENGIGRPSTYSRIVNTLLKTYVTKNKDHRLEPTENGYKTVDYLKDKFKESVDVNYTAELENKLDDIKEGEQNYVDVIDKFYVPFIKKIGEVNSIPVGKCPKCGHDLVMKTSFYGRFIACTNYPKCKYIEPIKKEEPKLLDRLCPKCGHQLVERKSKKGNTFVGCSNYPNCKYIEEKVSDKVCPECGHQLVERRNKKGKVFLGCSNYPKCHYIENIKKPKKEDVNSNNEKDSD